jgi:hypothetical protein
MDVRLTEGEVIRHDFARRDAGRPARLEAEAAVRTLIRWAGDDPDREETAAFLGIRPETVKTRLHRARRQLREALDEHLASTLKDTFPFAGARCARITEAVLRRLPSIKERS